MTTRIQEIVRIIIVGVILIIGIRWGLTVPSVIASPEDGVASPVPTPLKLTPEVHSTDVLPDESPTQSASQTITATVTEIATWTTTSILTPGTIAPTATSPHTDTRDPWVWGPRIIGGSGGVGVRDVGGYVYISVANGWRCNGALIDPEWVVTNAGCMVEAGGTRPQINISRIKVVVGCYQGDDCTNPQKRNPLWYGTFTEVAYPVQQVMIAPRPIVADADLTIALIKLSRPVVTGNGVSILPIGTGSDVVVGQNGLTVMSYGDEKPNKGPTALQRATYRIANDSACSALNGYVADMHQCGEPAPQVCKNDWGAPVTRIVNGQAVLYGILASQFAVHGASCPTNARSVAIDVTSNELRAWISSTVGWGRNMIARNLGGSSGYGTALARGNNRQHVVDVSSVFPHGIRIGNVTSTRLSINENGVIALGNMTSGIPAYVSMGPWRGAPVIVAFGADGDTTGTAQRPGIGGNSTGSNQVWVAQDVTRRIVVITWDDIRPFSTNVTGVRYIGNTYQAELRAQENGDVKVTLRYGVIGWTAGAGQCGATGCTQLAQVGIADGRGRQESGVPSSSDTILRQLSGKQLMFYVRDGTIYRVNVEPPVRPTWTASLTPTATMTPSLTPTITPQGYGLTDGLLAWYPLNGIRTTGSTLPVQVNTIMGAAQQFDGVNDYHQTSIDLANKSFTVAVWAQFNWKSDYQLVIAGGDRPGDNQGLMIGGINDVSRGTTAFYCGFYSNDLYYTLPGAFDKSTWHHYACTYDKNSGVRKILVDGIVVASDVARSSLQTTSHFWIGRSPWNNAYFRGVMRDVMVYNRALSLSEINRIKNLAPHGVMKTTPTLANQCRWIDGAGNVHEYEINHDLLTWDQAKAVAESRRRGGQRGYLATIMNDIEHNCLASFAIAHNAFNTTTEPALGPYIGAKNVTGTNVFHWMVGPEKGAIVGNYVGETGKNIGFERWATSPYLQPDLAAGSSQAIHLLWRTNMDWNDIPDTGILPSIIEYTYPAPNQTATHTPVRSSTPTRTVAQTNTPTPTATPYSFGLNSGLLAWYPLDGVRTTGSTVPVQVDSVMGVAQKFDGVDDYHQTTIDLANKTFSVAFWASFENEADVHSVVLGTGSEANTFKSFGCRYSYTPRNFGCGIYGPPDDMGLYYAGADGFSFWDWHHYAFTFDNTTKQMKLYVDGVLVDANTNPVSVLTSTSQFWIGRPSWGQPTWHFKGMLRDMFVYNRVLSLNEVQRIKALTPQRVMTTTPTLANQCRWIDGAGNVHEYEINHDLLSWDHARVVAESRRRGGQRGYLATVLSASENNCLVDLINAQSGWVSGSTGLGPWLGAKRVSQTGPFIWQGGPELGMRLDDNLAFNRFTGGNPDNNGNIENAVHIFTADVPTVTQRDWNDIADYALLKSIIEYTYPQSAWTMTPTRTITRSPTRSPTRTSTRSIKQQHMTLTPTAIARP